MARRGRLGAGNWWLRFALAATIAIINIAGTAAVIPIAAYVVPLPAVAHQDRVRLDNLVFASIYVGLAVIVGLVRGASLSRSALAWIYEDREPTERERRQVLRYPLRVFFLQAGLWSIAAVVFGVFNARYRVALGPHVAVIVFEAGLMTSSLSYLVAERLTRPFARKALRSGVPDRTGLRVGARTVLAWLLGCGVLLIGITFSGITALTLRDQATTTRLGVTMTVLGALAFVLGGSTIWLAAKATADPIRALRKAIKEVQRGNLAAKVRVYDGTEIGVLQAGFNEMLEGLRERERIHDLFGRHVGPDVARAALESGVRLGGEVRQVGALFVDIVGSTTMATNRPPEEVVSLLNRFFAIVIEVVNKHGGLINKFEGDAALAIWGAPSPAPTLEASLLAAARELGARLAAEIPELRAGIGVSAGSAVAGNVGAAERYEYTVIGDPVNEAARLTDLAKSVPSMVLANGSLLRGAGDEGTRWKQLEPVVVRGRSEPTPVATPVQASATRSA